MHRECLIAAVGQAGIASARARQTLARQTLARLDAAEADRRSAGIGDAEWAALWRNILAATHPDAARDDAGEEARDAQG